MTEKYDKSCVGCGLAEEQARLEPCSACGRFFCADCAVRAAGRRFCSAECSRAYYFSGEIDDDEDAIGDDE